MRPILLAITLFLAQAVAAQSKITGTITDNRNQPIAGASISLKYNYDGGTTDSAGRFSFLTNEQGQHVLVASAIGFKSLETKITLPGIVQPLQLMLREEITELKAVVISAGSFEASDRKK